MKIFFKKTKKVLAFCKKVLYTNEVGCERALRKRVLKAADTGSGILAQLGEHLPYKQRVIGSSPIGPIMAE